MGISTEKKKHSFNYQLLYRRACLVIYDIISIVASSFLALLVRYEFSLNSIPYYLL